MSGIFINIEGIPGESKDAKHVGWIDALSASYSVSQSSSAATGGGSGVGRANFGGFTFSHFVDKASPNLFTYCAAGNHIPKVVVSVCKSGGGLEEYLAITMEGVFVMNVMPSGSAGSQWIESVTLSYSKIRIESKEQKETGAMQATVTGGWNVKQNTA